MTIADVSAENSGWTLKISREDHTFYVVLTGPSASASMELRHWPSIERVYETLAGYFRGRGLSHVWAALRASVEAELR
jgi:hypothetical protein